MKKESKELKSKNLEDVVRSKKHLEYSFKKVKSIRLRVELDEEEPETLESFSSRFARLSDIIISKYFRILAIEKDPAFRGSVIDLLNIAEKFG